MLKIYQAETKQDIEIAKVLFSEFFVFLQKVLAEYDNFPWAIEYWQNCKEEVEGLPGKYNDPRTCILIAEYKGESAGCVGLIEENSGTGILQRLYVRKEFRGLGIGRSLVKSIIEHARNAGYRDMCLHTNLLLQPAINLYNSLGFEKVDHNKEYPEEIKDIVVQMELKLV